MKNKRQNKSGYRNVQFRGKGWGWIFQTTRLGIICSQTTFATAELAAYSADAIRYFLHQNGILKRVHEYNFPFDDYKSDFLLKTAQSEPDPENPIGESNFVDWCEKHADYDAKVKIAKKGKTAWEYCEELDAEIVFLKEDISKLQEICIAQQKQLDYLNEAKRPAERCPESPRLGELQSTAGIEERSEPTGTCERTHESARDGTTTITPASEPGNFTGGESERKECSKSFCEPRGNAGSNAQRGHTSISLFARENEGGIDLQVTRPESYPSLTNPNNWSE